MKLGYTSCLNRIDKHSQENLNFRKYNLSSKELHDNNDSQNDPRSWENYMNDPNFKKDEKIIEFWKNVFKTTFKLREEICE